MTTAKVMRKFDRKVDLTVAEVADLTRTLIDLYPFAKEALSVERRDKFMDAIESLQDAVEAALDPTFVSRVRS